jgi:hypothetical protein
MPSYTEEDVTNALNALVNGEYKSVRRAALVYRIPYPLYDIDFKNQNQEKKVMLVNITNSDRRINT